MLNYHFFSIAILHYKMKIPYKIKNLTVDILMAYSDMDNKIEYRTFRHDSKAIHFV